MAGFLDHLMGEEVGEFTMQTDTIRTEVPFTAPLVWMRAARCGRKTFLVADVPDGVDATTVEEELKLWRGHAVLISTSTDGLCGSSVFRVKRVQGMAMHLDAYPCLVRNERCVLAKLGYLQPSVAALWSLETLRWQCARGTQPAILAQMLEPGVSVASPGWRLPAVAARSAALLQSLFQSRAQTSPLGLAVRHPPTVIRGLAARPPTPIPSRATRESPRTPVPANLDAEFRIIVDLLTEFAQLPLPCQSSALPRVQMSREQEDIVTGLNSGLEALEGVAGRRFVGCFSNVVLF
jgi:hypothetical protein